MNNLAKDTAIAVLLGGPGAEREVSLVSGRAVAEALRNGGFTNVTEVEVHDTAPEIPAGTELAYNIIHGTFGEDGGVQSYLEERGIPYTGAGSRVSRMCFDKLATKEAMIAAGVATPAYEVLVPTQDGFVPKMQAPCVVKPTCEGSSVGVHILKAGDDVEAAVRESAQHGGTVLIEEYIQGKELTVGILDGRVLPVIHICPRSGFYDLSNKYPWMNLGGGTDYICPADLPDDVTARVQAEALAAYKALGVEVYARVDVLLRETDNQPFVLEINTIPGMTGSSLLPKAAQAVGISYEELCATIADLSLKQER